MIGWQLNSKDLEEVPEDAEGFIYLITYADGTMYVGRKSFWAKRKVKVPGKIRKKLVIKESDWKKYRGSSKEGKEKAKNGEVAKLEVLHLCQSKACLMFYEVKEMFLRDVLCDSNYLNANILLRMYQCVKTMEVKND